MTLQSKIFFDRLFQDSDYKEYGLLKGYDPPNQQWFFFSQILPTQRVLLKGLRQNISLSVLTAKQKFDETLQYFTSIRRALFFSSDVTYDKREPFHSLENNLYTRKSQAPLIWHFLLYRCTSSMKSSLSRKSNVLFSSFKL